ncbi:DUF4956 domain-containing protein [Patescibacteria group bacterium]|nr:DUF4956 domain-containing protein [Patescibacteria group bacterium]
MNEFLNLGMASPSNLSIDELVINLVLGLILSLVVRYLYFNYSQTISNKNSLGNVFPLLTIITVLIISVVKSSLALSLGLVGALSIVRFRSAIKEPEELIYLFLALVIGLALGADHRLPAIVVVVFIYLMLVVRYKIMPNQKKHNFMISFEDKEDKFVKEGNNNLLEIIKENSISSNLRRLDFEDNMVQARVMVKVNDMKNLMSLIHKLKEKSPHAMISFVDTDTIL